jgi:hypothetical protein
VNGAPGARQSRDPARPEAGESLTACQGKALFRIETGLFHNFFGKLEIYERKVLTKVLTLSSKNPQSSYSVV